MNAWEDPQAAEYYEAFCRSHSRYRDANDALIAQAHIEAGMALLDVGAGTGRTAEAALCGLGGDGQVLCVEPSEPMRTHGMRRLTDARIAWSAVLPSEPAAFDRILCGAALWQLQPLSQTLARLARLLRAGGALCFTIPAAYLLEPDAPGGGADPLLLGLPTLLMTTAESLTDDAIDSGPDAALQGPAAMDFALTAAGFESRSWRFRLRLTQQAYASWLKIPATGARLQGGMTPDECARRIDAALCWLDPCSWKWEGWYGWTAWKH